MVSDDVSGSLCFGDFRLDLADQRLIGPAGAIKLGRKAYGFLLLLIELDGGLLTKEVLFSSVWDGTIVSEGALTSVVKELRRALNDDARSPTYIETVYGRGYRLLVEVARPPGPETVRAIPAKTSFAGDGLAERPIFIVSAFDGSSVADEHPHLAAQLREEVLAGLGQFRELQLIADNRDDVEPAGRATGPAYRLNATILGQSNGVKAFARLRRRSDDVVIWSDSVQVTGAPGALDVEQIVRRIVGAALPVVDEDMVLWPSPGPASAYQAYLAAKWKATHAFSYEEAKEAALSLEQIIARHPAFTIAYPSLVRLYNTDFAYTGLGSTGAPERARALSLAKEGLAADRANAHAHSVLGFCYLWHDEIALARASFDRALALNPYNHVRVQEAATAFTYMGECETAHGLLERAAELNPLTDDDYHEDLGRLLLSQGDFAAAYESLRSLLSGSIWAELYLAVCEIRLARPGGRPRLNAWLQRVVRCWHSGEVPTSAHIADWIGRHHPFPAGTGAAFIATLDAELASAATSSHSAAR